MGRGAHCSDEIRFLVKKYRGESKSIRKIADLIASFKSMVSNAVNYRKTPEIRGRTKKNTERYAEPSKC